MRALLLAFVVACGGSAPPPPTTLPPAAPTPAPAPPSDPPTKVEGPITDAWTHGIHILVKRNPGSATTVTNLYIRGGYRNWTTSDAGIEPVALRTAVHGGTAKIPKDAFTQRLSDLGSTLEAETSQELSSIESWSLTPVWDKTFELLASAFTEPALPKQQLEIERQRSLASLANEQANPDQLLSLHGHEVFYAGSPYAVRAIGTKESVTAMTPDQVRAHLAKLRDRSRLLIVVVGDIDPARVIEATDRYFGQLPSTYQETKLPPIANRPGRVTAYEQKLPTNYIEAIAPGPAWGSPDFFPAWLAMTTLGRREFEEVRTKRNLSYAPSAYFNPIAQTTTAALYVTAVDPVVTMKVMLDEAKRLRDEPIPTDELEGDKSTFVTYNLMRRETAEGQAQYLAYAQLIGGDWHLLENLPAKIHAVTPAQIQAWAKAHLTKMQTVVIGDPSKLDRAALEGF
ncbi:MAG TPA: pitrilysin family protein [Kofleriaceae bacterium]